MVSIVTAEPSEPVAAIFNAAVFNSLACLLASKISALDAVVVPCAWSKSAVKYLPPITSTDGAYGFSVPVPMYNLSPLFAWVPATCEYANSPV